MSELPQADLEAALTTLSKMVETPTGRRILRRWIDRLPGPSAPPPPVGIGMAAALRGIAEGCEIIADHAAFMAEHFAETAHSRPTSQGARR